MIVALWPRKMRHRMIACVVVLAFFSRHDMCWLFHGWSPPSRFRYHRPRIASNGDQLGPVSWSIEHIVFVSYRIGILPRRHVQSILKLSAQIPTCRIHNMMCRFRDFASPYAQSRHTTPKGTHHNKTDSLGIRLIWVLLSSRSAIATATRTWREQQKMRDVLVLQRNFGHQPSNREICSISRLVLIPP